MPFLTLHQLSGESYDSGGGFSATYSNNQESLDSVMEKIRTAIEFSDKTQCIQMTFGTEQGNAAGFSCSLMKHLA